MCSCYSKVKFSTCSQLIAAFQGSVINSGAKVAVASQSVESHTVGGIQKILPFSSSSAILTRSSGLASKLSKRDASSAM